MTKTAIVPIINPQTIPNEEGVLNIHGFWDPPACVIDFWATGCKIIFESEEQFIRDSAQINDSYNKAIIRFYNENAL